MLLKNCEIVSLFNWVRITEAEVLQLEKSCTEYCYVNALFLQKVSPIVWTIGYVIPLHTKEMVQTLSFGLGLNTMQGHEVKHIKLKKYVHRKHNQCSKGSEVVACFQT